MVLAVTYPWASASSYLSSQSVGPQNGVPEGCVSRAGQSPGPKRKKENRQPKGGMGGRYTATTQGFFKEKGVWC